MSIAVSAVVKPSRFLLGMAALGCLFVAFIGVLVITGSIGELSYGIRLAIGMSCIFFALSGAFRLRLARKTHRIDISDNGQIRLMETYSDDTGEADKGDMHGGLVRLSADSTLWPFLLVLRLRREDGRVITLPILPDSLDATVFRALKVACGWVAARKKSGKEVNFSNF